MIKSQLATQKLHDVEHTFKLHNTTIEIRNMFELAEAFEIMGNDSYGHHVTDTRNDFATWAREVLQDKELSSRLKSAKNKKKAEKIVRQRIKELHAESNNSACPKEHIKCGIREFAAGLIVGLTIGVLLAVYVFNWI